MRECATFYIFRVSGAKVPAPEDEPGQREHLSGPVSPLSVYRTSTTLYLWRGVSGGVYPMNLRAMNILLPIPLRSGAMGSLSKAH